VLVDPPSPGILPHHRPLLEAQVGVVGLQPAQVPLLGTAQDAEPLGRLVGLPGGRAQPVLGQHQPLPGRAQVPPVSPAPLEGCDLLGGGLVAGAGVLAGLLGLGGPSSGQVQLPRAVRRAGSP
jgi:hypothetical protein